MPVNMILAFNQLCFACFRSEESDPEQEVSEDSNLFSLIETGRSHSVTSAVGDHLLCCSLPICAVDDRTLPESKTQKVK